MFGSYTRDQLRRTYSEAWRKQLDGTPLSPLEAMIADVIGLHPEYQSVVHDADAALTAHTAAASGTENPFLHMGLHIAVREQLSIDRPAGIAALHKSIRAASGDAHDADHVLMESLAETLWEAQRSNRPPDETDYIGKVRQRLDRRRF